MHSDLSAKPEYVLRYFAHMDPAYAAELIRRRRVEARGQVSQYFKDEVSAVVEISKLGAGTWGKVVDFLLAPRVERKMRTYGVTFADLVEFAGLCPKSLM